MTPLSLRRWRGLTALSRDAVVAGSHAVERVHLETARRPFGVLEKIPLIAAPAAAVHCLHDAAVATVHGAVRLTARSVGAVLEVALAAAARAAAAGVSADDPGADPPEPARSTGGASRGGSPPHRLGSPSGRAPGS